MTLDGSSSGGISVKPLFHHAAPEGIDFSLQLIHALFVRGDLLFGWDAHRLQGLVNVLPQDAADFVFGLDNAGDTFRETLVVDQFIQSC